MWPSDGNTEIAEAMLWTCRSSPSWHIFIYFLKSLDVSITWTNKFHFNRPIAYNQMNSDQYSSLKSPSPWLCFTITTNCIFLESYSLPSILYFGDSQWKHTSNGVIQNHQRRKCSLTTSLTLKIPIWLLVADEFYSELLV